MPLKTTAEVFPGKRVITAHNGDQEMIGSPARTAIRVSVQCHNEQLHEVSFESMPTVEVSACIGRIRDYYGADLEITTAHEEEDPYGDDD